MSGEKIRFGHTLLQKQVQKHDIKTLKTKSDFYLHFGIRNVSHYEADNGLGMEELLAGLIIQKASMPGRHMTGIHFSNVEMLQNIQCNAI